jgi:hypothetical protein
MRLQARAIRIGRRLTANPSHTTMRKKPHMKEINELFIAIILNFLKKRNDISSDNQQYLVVVMMTTW